ncbi:hypothetical protein ABZ297_20095 [Nonomuraea sp. NPDC005983]|uniref:hypothetical protein n=1 Tax=Nonomuraea sp. NPDC005983 TaxID=3155595 RepID=UPI0033BDD690
MPPSPAARPTRSAHASRRVGWSLAQRLREEFTTRAEPTPVRDSGAAYQAFRRLSDDDRELLYANPELCGGLTEPGKASITVTELPLDAEALRDPYPDCAAQ